MKKNLLKLLSSFVLFAGGTILTIFAISCEKKTVIVNNDIEQPIQPAPPQKNEEMSEKNKESDKESDSEKDSTELPKVGTESTNTSEIGSSKTPVSKEQESNVDTASPTGDSSKKAASKENVSTKSDLNEKLNKISLKSKVTRWPSGIRRNLQKYINFDTEINRYFKEIIEIENIDPEQLNNISLEPYEGGVFWNKESLSDNTGTIKVKLKLKKGYLISDPKEFVINNTYLKDKKILTSKLLLSTPNRKNTRASTITEESHLKPFYKLKEEFLDFDNSYQIRVNPIKKSPFKELGALQVTMTMEFPNGETLHNDTSNNSIWLYGFDNTFAKNRLSGYYQLIINGDFKNPEEPTIAYDINKIHDDLLALPKDKVWDYILKKGDYLKKFGEPILLKNLKQVYQYFINETLESGYNDLYNSEKNSYFLNLVLKEITLKNSEILLEFSLINHFDKKKINEETLKIKIKNVD